MTTQVQSRIRSDAQRRYELKKDAASGNWFATAHLIIDEVLRNDAAIQRRIETMDARQRNGQPRTA